MAKHSRRYRNARRRYSKSAWDQISFNKRLLAVIRSANRASCDMRKLDGILGLIAEQNEIMKECAQLIERGAS